jgi:DNA-binding LacI/PurR family transcriptional regulator
MNARRRVTASDVAQVAGVSKTTVSYVLNETPHQKIPEETRERVLDAVRRLNYTPNSLARALRKGHSDTVLLVLPDWPLGRVVSGIIEALTEQLERHGLSLLTRREREGVPLASMWRDLSPAGVVAFHDVDEHEQGLMRDAGVHVATALLTSDRSPAEALVLPQELIGSLQVQHLAARGHRRVAYAALRGPRTQVFVDLRLRGARRACMELGLEEPEVVELNAELAEATAAVRGWHGRDSRVTGVAAYNDELAVAILAGMRSEGLRAPEDLAVIGVDDEPLGRFSCPPLTTVQQNEQMIASHIAQTIVEGLKGGSAPRPMTSEAISLIIREST